MFDEKSPHDVSSLKQYTAPVSGQIFDANREKYELIVTHTNPGAHILSQSTINALNRFIWENKVKPEADIVIRNVQFH